MISEWNYKIEIMRVFILEKREESKRNDFN